MTQGIPLTDQVYSQTNRQFLYIMSVDTGATCFNGRIICETTDTKVAGLPMMRNVSNTLYVSDRLLI